MSRSHVLLGLLIAANIGMGILVFDLYAGTGVRVGEPVMMPAGLSEVTTVAGDPIGARGDGIAVLAFVRSSDENALDVVRRVASGPDADAVDVVLFSDGPMAVSARLSGEGIRVARASHVDWLRLLDSENELEAWRVYDGEGVLRGKGNFVSGGLEGTVGKVLGITPEYSSVLLASRLQPHFSSDGSGFLADEAAAADGPRAVFFLGQFSSGCPIERAVRRTSAAAAEAEGVPFEILVPPAWSDLEINALRVNLSIGAPVRRAPAGVADEWRQLGQIYGPGVTAGFFVTFERGTNPQVLTETDPILRLLGVDDP